MNNRVIIIGGMGPQASLELHKRILDDSAANGACRGDDFPEIVHVSIPVRDFIADESQTKQALGRITRSMSCLYPWQKRPNTFSLQYGALTTAGIRA